MGYNTWNSNLNSIKDLISQDTNYRIDEFVYFNRALYSQDIQLINSGWIADFASGYTGSGIITTTGVTGYVTGQIILDSGVTGHLVVGTGLFTNEYGVEYTGYTTGYATGYLYGSGVVELTGEILTPEYFYNDPSIVVNSGFVRTFYSAGAVLLKKVDYNDTISLLGETVYIGNLDYNNVGHYDLIKDQFRVFTNDEIIVWLNGLSQFSGNLINTGTIYNPIYVLEKDYYKTGSYLETTGFYDNADYLDYLKIASISYYNNSFNCASGDTITLTGYYSGNNSLVFFNGQYLTNSGNYYNSGSNIIFNSALYEGVTGTLAIVNLNNNFINKNDANYYITGNTTINPNYSLIFLNGQKQIENIDYLYSDKVTFLTYSGLFESKEDTIFDSNNDNLFFNIT